MINKNQDVWIWNSYAKTDQGRSIPNYLEENASRLRAKYLSFIHDIGEKVFDGKQLVAHLKIKPGISLWWMSLLAEKSPFKSPHIVDCLKLIALEEVLKLETLKAIKVIGVNDSKVAIAIESLCCNLGVYVSLEGNYSKLKTYSLVKILYYRLPHPIQAIISLIHRLVQRWPLRQAKPTLWFSDKRSVFFMSYFIHLEENSCIEGRFHSRQWEILPKVLHEKGFQCNWLHHFIYSKVIPDTNTGVDWVERFNKDAKSQGMHTFLDSYLSLAVVLRAVVNWLKILWRSFFLPKIELAFRPANSAICLWPLLKDDWYRSFRGSQAIQNALLVELFDIMMSNLPRQRLGLYLYEGQGWESAFIHAWRKHGHGKLIAVSHSTVRFWDLRYFNNPQVNINEGALSKPRPDFIAVNGLVAKQAFLETGIPYERILEVEALRYLNLATFSYNRKFISSQLTKCKKRLLVLGDIMTSHSQKAMQVIQDLPKNNRDKFNILVKSHPYNPINKSDYPSINFEVTTGSLHEILNQFDLAYGANPTSANLDAYVAGLKVIIHLDGESLNFSPLRGIEEVSFVSNYKELIVALGKYEGIKNDATNEFFWLDNELPKWRNIIKCFSDLAAF